MPFRIDIEITVRDELPENIAPVHSSVFLTNAKGTDLIMTVALNTFVNLSSQHFYHIIHAETLTGTINSGQSLKRSSLWWVIV